MCLCFPAFDELVEVFVIMEEEDATSTTGAEEVTTFSQLGIKEDLCKVCDEIGWKVPTKIQRESIPHSLQGRDVIGLAETGSGKTGAFALPIMQDLLEQSQKMFALVLTPTRELAFQISEHFQALGSAFGVKCAVVVGGVDQMTQSLQLAKRPHIIIATPGQSVQCFAFSHVVNFQNRQKRHVWKHSFTKYTNVAANMFLNLENFRIMIFFYNLDVQKAGVWPSFIGSSMIIN